MNTLDTVLVLVLLVMVSFTVYTYNHPPVSVHSTYAVCKVPAKVGCSVWGTEKN
jgi:hypothetical protein